eukprot:TRINITY_DN29288_c0_g1_i1.p1 TRINITY_DN29288_c0_g1~~TRINITY_DN29288_c0_g1_i1.p1  ORF type:complete len:298 (+),score=30.58 TRINITY_DN29288_c0_g1_i1:137-1030(+)
MGNAWCRRRSSLEDSGRTRLLECACHSSTHAEGEKAKGEETGPEERKEHRAWASAATSFHQLRQRKFTDETLSEAYTFLTILHRRSASNWCSLPDLVCRNVCSFLLVPICSTFVHWTQSEFVTPSPSHRGLKIQPSVLGGVARCGPRMAPGSGVYEIEFDVHAVGYADGGFCRVDIGLVLADKVVSRRCDSGLRWEAGDGDVHLDSDIGGLDASGQSGWLGDDKVIETGILPRWDGRSNVGLVFDTYDHVLQFKFHGDVMPYSRKLPNDIKAQFVFSWDLGSGGIVHIRQFRRMVKI